MVLRRGCVSLIGHAKIQLRGWNTTPFGSIFSITITQEMFVESSGYIHMIPGDDNERFRRGAGDDRPCPSWLTYFFGVVALSCGSAKSTCHKTGAHPRGPN